MSEEAYQRIKAYHYILTSSDSRNSSNAIQSLFPEQEVHTRDESASTAASLISYRGSLQVSGNRFYELRR
jgi:hypothetical protein